LALRPIGSGNLATYVTWARDHNLTEMLVQDGLEVGQLVVAAVQPLPGVRGEQQPPGVWIDVSASWPR
jgi:hypothetical protein